MEEKLKEGYELWVGKDIEGNLCGSFLKYKFSPRQSIEDYIEANGLIIMVINQLTSTKMRLSDSMTHLVLKKTGTDYIALIKKEMYEGPHDFVGYKNLMQIKSQTLFGTITKLEETCQRNYSYTSSKIYTKGNKYEK